MLRLRPGSAFGALTATLLWAALLLGLWVALTDNTLRWDTIVGLGCAIVAGALTHLTARSGRVRLEVRWRWLARAAAAPWWIVRDTVGVARVVAASLARGERPQGRMHPVRWAPGGDTPLDRGRRVVAYSAGSAGPNQYVVAASAEDGVLVVHELAPTSSVSAVDLVREEDA